MKERIKGILLGFAIFAMVAASAGLTLESLDERVSVLEALHGIGTTTTTTSTTSTSSTSTTVPTTTTTTPNVELVIPETLPIQEGITLVSGEGFTIITSCLTGKGEDCGAGNQNVTLGSFDYIGHGMPYIYPEGGLHAHAWWVAGDREAYACGYGFMYDQHPSPFGSINPPRPGHFIARFTIVRPDGQGYGGVLDKYMDEAVRYYDGSPNFGTQNEITDENCQLVSLEPDFDYDAYVPHGADAIRVGLFRADGAIADIRDFTQVSTPGHFEFISLSGGRAQIVQIYQGKVSHVFYYDTLADGRIAVEVNGVTISE